MTKAILCIVYASALNCIAATVSVVQERDSQGYKYVTYEAVKEGPVTGKLSNSRITKELTEFKDTRLAPYVEGRVLSTELNIKEPVIVGYVLGKKKSGKKFGKKIFARNGQGRNDGKIVWQYDTGEFLPRKRSLKATEVSGKLWRMFKCVTLSPREDAGIPWNKDDEVVCYRMEMWCDGKLLDAKDTSRPSVLKKLGLDQDWYVEGKTKGKVDW